MHRRHPFPSSLSNRPSNCPGRFIGKLASKLLTDGTMHRHMLSPLRDPSDCLSVLWVRWLAGWLACWLPPTILFLFSVSIDRSLNFVPPLSSSFFCSPISFIPIPLLSSSLRSKYADCRSPQRQNCGNLVRRRRQLVIRFSHDESRLPSSSSSPRNSAHPRNASNFFILCTLGGNPGKVYFFLSSRQRVKKISSLFRAPSSTSHPFRRKSSLKRGSTLPALSLSAKSLRFDDESKRRSLRSMALRSLNKT